MVAQRSHWGMRFQITFDLLIWHVASVPMIAAVTVPYWSSVPHCGQEEGVKSEGKRLMLAESILCYQENNSCPTSVTW